jgi:hypothetical protein
MSDFATEPSASTYQGYEEMWKKKYRERSQGKIWHILVAVSGIHAGCTFNSAESDAGWDSWPVSTIGQLANKDVNNCR